MSGTPTENTPTAYEFSLSAADASDSRTRMVSLSVIAEEIQTVFTSNIQIQATENTNYGIDNVATMVSEIQTAHDGLATYQISIELTPAAGKAIVSGESGGSSTTKSFGVGTTNADDLFTGSNEEWIDNIGNIEIINFDANGGTLTEANLVSASFSSIHIMNAQSTNDNLHIELDDFLFKYGKTPANSYDLDLIGLSGGVEINEFAIGTGNTSTTNKWSIEGITVEVVFEHEDIITNLTELNIQTSEEQTTTYPNPTSGVFHLTNTKASDLKIFNSYGHSVMSINRTTTNQKIDLSKYPNGLYFIQVQKENSIETISIIKQ